MDDTNPTPAPQPTRGPFLSFLLWTQMVLASVALGIAALTGSLSLSSIFPALQAVCSGLLLLHCRPERAR